jgi:anti-sigma factor RsiW
MRFSGERALACQEFVEFLAEYPDGELPPDAAAPVDRHLMDCAACGSYTRSYAQTLRLEKKACGAGTALEAPERLVRAVIAAVSVAA